MKIEYKGPSWDVVRRKIKPLFLEAGVTECELAYEGCKRNSYLSFAHSLRRNKIKDKYDMESVILACVPCHQILDAMEHEETYDIVNYIRANRPRQVRSMFEKTAK